MADRYEPSTFEAKWRQRWKEADLFLTQEEPGRPKFYGLDFFPYPSGAGLSVGHSRNYVPTDVICRMKTMQGYNVLHPMGFDAFGLPAENEAIKRKTHPAPMIDKYAANYRRQMELIGISYDWSRSFASSDPSYYKWTQWIFEVLYKRGLAYRKLASVNWDPVDKTVLADEEVVAGRAERSGALVEKKWIPQWFFKITDYAERLINDLDELDWPEGIKSQQRNWIGRSEGVQFTMPIVFLPADVAQKAAEVASEPDEPEDELKALEREIRESGFQPEADPSVGLKAQFITAKLDIAAGAVEKGVSNGLFDDIVARITARVPGFEVVQKERRPTFEVFTTRVDTVFGMTFCVLAPEHPVLEQILPRVDPEHREAVKAYQLQAKTLSDTDRAAANREKTGVFTGAYALNPANGRPVPIWIADYVLSTYGTGAIMAVPAHDQRDFDFAVKFGIDVIPVIKPTAEYLKGFSNSDTFDFEIALKDYEANVKAYNPVFETKDSTLINSGEYTGQTVAQSQTSLGEWMEGLGIGQRKIQYKLRDWLISRQRYWGCPIPVIHTKDGDMQLAPESSLPIELPMVEHYEPTGDGTSPLAHIEEFVNTTDLDGRLGMRETDTMGGFACSSWYFLRFCDPSNPDKPWDEKLASYWMPVDCYVGGAEHAVMHLLYARFWTKVLFDAGLITVKEPFKTLHNQGQVLAQTPYRKPREGEQLSVGEDGVRVSFAEAKEIPADQLYWRWARMSKSKGNVVAPDEMVETYGADALRLYLLFKAPFNADIEWENKGVEDLGKFLNRVFRLVETLKPFYVPEWKDTIAFEVPDEVSKKIRRVTHQTIRNCTDDIDKFGFNTYVSWLMKFVNALNDVTPKLGQDRAQMLAASEAVDTLILLLAPGAPHSADELWESLGREGFTHKQTWPKFEEALAVEDTVTIAVQINGKLRDTFDLAVGASKEEHETIALARDKVKVYTDGNTVRKVIVVPGKLVNIVVA